MRGVGVVIWLICAVLVGACGGAPTAEPPPSPTPLTLDPARSHGNLFADGRLPVGDGKIVTDGPRPGYVYACPRYAQSFAGGSAAGAQTRGPWFSEDGAWYYPDKKVHVQGHERHEGAFSETRSEGVRVIKTNDLPRNHTTGRFPIATDDTAYQYDRNPNAITAQELTYVLASEPTYGTPQCIGHEVGVMLSGVVLFSALDADGRDAGAWEVQDDCSGHPEVTGSYHYHTPSPCLAQANIAEVVGYALDGFPITGARVGEGNILTTRDLDECHGITSIVRLDGRDVSTYHYVMTQDYPYSVNCFRGRPTAVQGARPPGPPPGFPPPGR
ncbi:Uncharacterised protein [Mycobacteroides abscessus subsp. abscessus]|nr:Uncharacterised protein [Mycobacteroides abscessus subsp. abscessus]